MTTPTTRLDALRNAMKWSALLLIFMGAGLSVTGSFLGSERARDFFTSKPLLLYWSVFALTLVAGFVVFSRMRRDFAVAAIHLGFLLVMLGFVLGSDTFHRRPDAAGRERVRWAYLPLRVGATSSVVWDQELKREIGKLPFAVRLDAFDIEYYPLQEQLPSLFYGKLTGTDGAHHPTWETKMLKWELGRHHRVPGSQATFRVVKADVSKDGQKVQVRLQLRWKGKCIEQTVTCEKPATFTRIRLKDVFPEYFDLNETASLFVAPPEKAVRLYRSRVTVFQGTGQPEREAEILVNRPLHVAGYHLYQHSWGDWPERYSVLLVVSDQGSSAVYAGFAFLTLGTVWLYWRPRHEGGR